MCGRGSRRAYVTMICSSDGRALDGVVVGKCRRVQMRIDGSEESDLFVREISGKCSRAFSITCVMRSFVGFLYLTFDMGDI